MKLDHGPHEIIRQLLVDLGVGSFPANPPGNWPVYAEGEPANPDNVITVYATTSTPDGRMQVTGEAAEHFGFQVRVAAGKYRDGWTKAKEIKEEFETGVLGESVSITLSTKVYFVPAITRIGPVICLGKDVPNTKVSLFTINATAPITQTA